MSHTLLQPSYIKLWFSTLKSVFPFLFHFYDLPFVAPDIDKYFVNLTEQAIHLRGTLTEQPDDYLNFLLRLREKKGLTVRDVTAHTITFFLDAFETSSIVLTHALYRLAQKKQCQDKLRKEIQEYGDNIDFDVVSRMKYLDQVFNGE